MARYLIKLTGIFTKFAYISYSAVEVGQRLWHLSQYLIMPEIYKQTKQFIILQQNENWKGYKWCQFWYSSEFQMDLHLALVRLAT